MTTAVHLRAALESLDEIYDDLRRAYDHDQWARAKRRLDSLKGQAEAALKEAEAEAIETIRQRQAAGKGGES